MILVLVAPERSIKSVMVNKRKPQSIHNLNEKKAIKLIAEALKTDNIESQKTFDWLLGDKGTRLRVDGYFPSKNLVVEYHGAQHFLSNKLMDRRPGRAEQRRRYTELRKKLIPKHGLKLLEIRYDEPLTLEHISDRLRDEGYKI